MCGLAGVLDTSRSTADADLGAICAGMADAVRHRGPDAEGVWTDASAGIGLGHRRLAVLDLTETGSQPMASRCGRFVLAFNGEVYNFRALRTELEREGAAFRGSSDTEVLVEGISRWGVLPTLTRVNGMFAFALWDRHDRRLTLGRDRLGEKPLYYAWSGACFLFGSELSALRRAPDFRPALHRGGLSLLLRYSYIPAPHTIYDGVSKLLPGHLLHLDEGSRTPEVAAFWSLRDAAEGGADDPFHGTDGDAADELEQLLSDSVRLRLEADVPLAVFLSGGVDSSVVAALAQQQSERPLHTFTVGVLEDGGAGDERAAAAAVADHLGTIHREVSLSASDALETVGRLATIWDEPFADPSQVPTAMLCAAARAHATVCLSGDGGDEVFAGYNRYVLGASAYRRSRALPSAARRVLARALLASSPEQWDRRWRAVERAVPRGARQYAPGDKLHKLAGVLAAGDMSAAYVGLISHWAAPDDLVLGAVEPLTPATSGDAPPRLVDDVSQMVFLDTQVGLPDDMLVKVDRASMAVGLEVRAPLLDHRLVELAWRLPPDLKIRAGRGKWLLRQVAERHVPAALLDRPKLGFDPPIDTWLRGPLRPWAEDLLAEERLVRQGLFAPSRVRARWEEHLSGRRNHGYALWAVLMAQQWLDEHEAA